MSATAPNPLAEIQFQIPFDQVRAGDVQPGIAALLTDAREKLAAMAAGNQPRTFENTLVALERVTERLDYAMSVVRHLEGVCTTPELRAAFNAVEPEVSAFYSSIPLNQGIWNCLKSYESSGAGRTLNPTRKRFLKKTVDSFRRHGADLDADGKRRLAEIDVELTRLTTKFSENVLDSTNAFELIVEDEGKLAGLPPTAVAAAKESALLKGASGWRFTLQSPSYIALITYLDDRGIREQVYRAHVTRAAIGEFDNREILPRILALRQEKAKLLGFRDFADLVLEDRMAHSGERALQFLEDLKKKTEAPFRRENEELDRFAGFPLEAWDIAYYAEKQRRALYDFDEEALRPYFPTERVVAGMFNIVQRLYGIRVTERKGVPVWHSEVSYYTIHDESGLLLGAFYSDWYPRESKRDGAWMDAFVTGVDAPERFEPHVGAICGNLTPPVGEKPALLTHREVETIFHEFGHLLHHCLSRVEVRSLAGTSVAWDFVELPSQIMENWCWEREALDLFARHYESGETIPEDLFRKMHRARNFRSANAQMRQLGFGFVDLALHTRYSPGRDGDPVDYARNLIQAFSPAPLPPDNAMIAGFTHLFSSPVGYGAGYYSYKWAEVLDADAFTRFREKGIFNREVGLEFLENILARGDSEDPAELYRRFMGRDPDPNALLERSGLAGG
ncbi:MAG: M3 family metallopeptidase [Acidobacteriota bacterium]|nr:M3 family metallopeptidase [Acidobacteriota bacterium]